MLRRLSVGMIALVLVGATGVAGAGQGSVQKSDYIDEGDNLCLENDLLIDELVQEHFAAVPEGQEPTAEQLAAFYEDALPHFEDLLGSLRALPKPAGDAKKLKKLYNSLEKVIDKIADDPGVVLADANPFAKVDKLAVKYGFRVCGADDE